MKNKFIKKIALSSAIMLMSTTLTAFADETVQVNPVTSNNTGDILVLGGDLTQSETTALLNWFEAPAETKTIHTTNEMIIKQLGLDANDPKNYQGGCYSSAYVRITEPSLGKGNASLNVDVRNLTEVTDIMLMNALITSGITAANVKVSAPFPVTGTSALAGILAGAEDVRGKEISLKQKETAQKEIETTMDVAEEIGSEEASSIINEIKTEVIKESPKNEKEIEKIVNNIINNYNINITDNSKNEIVSLMSDVNDIDLDYDQIKDSLEEAGTKIKDKLTDLGKELKESGVWDKFMNWCKTVWNNFTNWLSNIFNDADDIQETGEPENAVDTPALDVPVTLPSNEDDVKIDDSTIVTPENENLPSDIIMPDEEQPAEQPIEEQPTEETENEPTETSEVPTVIVYDYTNTREGYMGLSAPKTVATNLTFN